MLTYNPHLSLNNEFIRILFLENFDVSNSILKRIVSQLIHFFIPRIIDLKKCLRKFKLIVNLNLV